MIKSFKSKLLGGVFLLTFTVLLTSCDDILGEWNPPVPAAVIEEKISPVLAAIENGEDFTINFNLNGSDYFVTFQKTGDNTYTVKDTNISGFGSGTRGTRAASLAATLTYEGGKLIFKLSAGDILVMRVTLNPSDSSYEVFTLPEEAVITFTSLEIGEDKVVAEITPTTKIVTIHVSDGDIFWYYLPGETWSEWIERQGEEYGEGAVDDINTIVSTMLYYDESCTDQVNLSDVIGKKGDADVDRYYVPQST